MTPPPARSTRRTPEARKRSEWPVAPPDNPPPTRLLGSNLWLPRTYFPTRGLLWRDGSTSSGALGDRLLGLFSLGLDPDDDNLEGFFGVHPMSLTKPINYPELAMPAGDEQSKGFQRRKARISNRQRE